MGTEISTQVPPPAPGTHFNSSVDDFFNSSLVGFTTVLTDKSQPSNLRWSPRRLSVNSDKPDNYQNKTKNDQQLMP